MSAGNQTTKPSLQLHKSILDLFILYVMFSLIVYRAYCSMRSTEAVVSPGAEVLGGSELPCGCAELSHSLLQKRQVYLRSKPSLQSPGLSQF